MKNKLWMAAAAVFALGAAAYADIAKMSGTTGTSFEGLQAGWTIGGAGSGANYQGPNPEGGTGWLDEDGSVGSPFYWWFPETGAGIIGTITQRTETSGAWGDYVGDLPGVAAKESLTPATDGQYLKLDSADRIERLATGSTGELKPVSMDGVYFDTMVQFSTTYANPVLNFGGSSITSGKQDKIAVWLYGADGDENIHGAGTNLVITALRFGGTSSTGTMTQYVIPAENMPIEPGKWYRLTIKSIKTICDGASINVPGFVVFIDGQPVCRGADNKNDIFTANETFSDVVANSLTATAQKWNAQGALFPSLDLSDQTRDQLTAAAFIGAGALDDVTFTSEAPAFAADDEVFNIVWTEGVDTLLVNGTAPEGFVKGQAGSFSPTWSSGSSYTVYAKPQDGWTHSGWRLNGTAVTPENDAYTFYPQAAGETAYLNFANSQAKIGDQFYASLAEALAAASAAGERTTIKILTDIAAQDMIEITTSDVVIDLDGHKISYDEALTEYPGQLIYVDRSTVTLISSQPGGEIEFVEDDSDLENAMGVVCVEADSTFIIGADEGDTGVTVNGYIQTYGVESAAIKVVRGTLLDDNDFMLDGDALLSAYVPEGAEAAPVVTWNQAGTFFTVAPAGEEPPVVTKTFEAALSQSSATYTGAGLTPQVEVRDAETKADLASGTDYTLSWTSAEIVNAGEYTATVTGLGDYAGCNATLVFTVEQKTASVALSLDPAQATWTEGIKLPSPTVACEDSLGEDDYEIAWTLAGEPVDSSEALAEPSADVEYVATVTPKTDGNYNFAAATATFTLKTPGYESPDGSTFDVPDGVVTLPAGKTLSDTAATVDGTAINYATAYALNLTIAADGTVSGEIKVGIEIKDGQVVLADPAGRDGFTLSVKYKVSDDLATWREATENDFIAGAKKFYKVDLSRLGVANAE